jgi:hypothetical protein
MDDLRALLLQHDRRGPHDNSSAVFVDLPRGHDLRVGLPWCKRLGLGLYRDTEVLSRKRAWKFNPQITRTRTQPGSMKMQMQMHALVHTEATRDPATNNA